MFTLSSRSALHLSVYLDPMPQILTCLPPSISISYFKKSPYIKFVRYSSNLKIVVTTHYHNFMVYYTRSSCSLLYPFDAIFTKFSTTFQKYPDIMITYIQNNLLFLKADRVFATSCFSLSSCTWCIWYYIGRVIVSFENILYILYVSIKITAYIFTRGNNIFFYIDTFHISYLNILATSYTLCEYGENPIYPNTANNCIGIEPFICSVK